MTQDLTVGQRMVYTDPSSASGGDGPLKVFAWSVPGPRSALGAVGLGGNVDPRALPLQTLSEKLRTAAETNANSIVLYARQNPDVQRLVSAVG